MLRHASHFDHPPRPWPHCSQHCLPFHHYHQHWLYAMSAALAAQWAEAHKDPQGPGDARPTAMDVIRAEKLEGAWADKVVLITGASSGIGVETARALHAAGAHLFLPVRDVKKGEVVVADIVDRQRQVGGKGGKIDVLELDLSSLQSVRQCAAEVLSRSKQLHILICNAGVMATPESRTADGFETQFGTNHLAHFLLFQLLRPSLLASSTPTFASRVVCVSSAGHGFSPVRFGDLDLKQMGYDPWVAYGQSKTANIHMASKIERRYGHRGLHALSLTPGSIQSGLQKHLTPEVLGNIMKRLGVQQLSGARYKSAAQGAATTVWAAVAAEWEGKGGRYLENCSVAAPSSGQMSGYAAHAFDEEAAQRLWVESCGLVGLEGEAQD